MTLRLADKHGTLRIARLFTFLPFFLPLYVVRFHIGPIPTTLLEIAILILTGVWMMQRGKEGIQSSWTRLTAWRWPLLLWLIAGIVGVIVSPVTLQALGLFRAYFIEPLLVFLMGLDVMRTEDDRSRLWKHFSIATILCGIWAGIQMLTGWGIPHPWDAVEGRRATGPFPFPNALALFVTPIAALAMAKVVHALDTMKEAGRTQGPSLHGAWWDIAVVVFGVFAMLCAQSDGGLVAFGGATFIALLMHKHSRRFAIELAVAGLIAIVLIAPLRTHITKIIFFQDWSGMVRTVMWKETGTMLQDHAIFGAGLAGYPAAIAPYHKATWMEVFQYPHNILLNLWSETGLIGIVAFGWIVVTWIKTGRQDGQDDGSFLHKACRPVILSVLCAMLIHGLVDVPYFKNDLAVAFWLFVLLTTPSYEQKTSAG